MSLFGSSKDDVLDYVVWLSDPVLVATLQGTAFFQNEGAGVIYLAPAQAAITYAAPLVEGHLHQSQATPFPGAPCITSTWFLNTAPAQYPRDVAAGQRTSGGFLGFFTTTHFFYWRGTFKWAPKLGDQPVAGQAPGPMPIRRWVDGFEMIGSIAGANAGEGGAGNGIQIASRSASRHLQGFGLHFDNVSNVRSHTPIDAGHAASGKQWERFYIRVHRFPTAAAAIWRSSGAVSGNAGVEVQILPSGQLGLVNIDSIGTRTTIVTTSAIAVHVWKKLDLAFKYDAALGSFTLWINGVVAGSFLATTIGAGLGGIQQTQNIQSSTIGDPNGAGKNLTIDYDDWIGGDAGAAEGTSATVDTSTADWNAGSRCALIGPRAFASDHNAAWIGDWRLVRQRPIGGTGTTALTTSTALARLSVTTDATDEVDYDPLAQGIAALVVGLHSTRGTNSGQLGYRFTPAAAVMAAITQAVGLDWNATAQMILFSVAAAVPKKLADPATKLCILELVHDKGNDGVASTVKALFAVAEVIGTFGAEDIGPSTTAGQTIGPPPSPIVALAGETPLQTQARYTADYHSADRVAVLAAIAAWILNKVSVAVPPLAIGLHNAPYPRTPWARKGVAPPTSPYAIYGGTYVGNGTFQDLPFATPIHFLWIRPVTGGAGGVEWWSSLNAAHLGGGQSYEPDAPVEVLIDPLFVPGVVETPQLRTIVRIAGLDANKNAAGVTYAYVAVGDPGIRFLNAGAFKVYGGTTDYVEQLDVAAFNPDWVFVLLEQNGNTGTQRLHSKGPGSAATFLTPVGAAEIAGLSKAAGSLTAKTALLAVNPTSTQIAYLAIRKNDGSADVGLPGVAWITSYVGDGSASRTITFAPASGLRPQWAMVVGHDGTTIQRDHQHTGTTSTQFPNSANAATGITGGGIDSLSVGSVLNANGVTYDVLVFPGSATAGNGGFSPAVINVPVDPAPPPGGAGTPWDPTPAQPEAEVPVVVTPVVAPGGDVTDFGTQCVVASTKIINQALSHIGISKYVLDILLEQSEEAAAARLHYSDDLSATLRDFPWPFATRYANLVRVAGTLAAPVNLDWVYAFRAPDFMMFARRIVNPSQIRRAFDPSPIDFRVGSDDTGPLIYTNQVAVIDGAVAEPLLEYTIRPTCAASTGDALFREALAYRHAASLALPLARDKDKATFCLQVYQSLLVRAQIAAANEGQQDPPGDAAWIIGRA